MALQAFKILDEHEQASYFHARERRRSLAGIPEMFRTTLIQGSGVMAITNIDTDLRFPDRQAPVTFKTAIRITEQGNGQHRGLVFEFGDEDIGAALWIGDDTIGFTAGGEAPSRGATALFNNGSELPVGLELDIVVACRPGDGQAVMWLNGRQEARGFSNTATFGVANIWAEDSNGSFASAPHGTVTTDVPLVSRIAPAGFEVIEPLSVYAKQIPRHFLNIVLASTGNVQIFTEGGALRCAEDGTPRCAE